MKLNYTCSEKINVGHANSWQAVKSEAKGFRPCETMLYKLGKMEEVQSKVILHSVLNVD